MKESVFVGCIDDGCEMGLSLFSRKAGTTLKKDLRNREVEKPPAPQFQAILDLPQVADLKKAHVQNECKPDSTKHYHLRELHFAVWCRMASTHSRNASESQHSMMGAEEDDSFLGTSLTVRLPLGFAGYH